MLKTEKYYQIFFLYKCNTNCEGKIIKRLPFFALSQYVHLVTMFLKPDWRSNHQDYQVDGAMSKSNESIDLEIIS